MVSRFLGVVGLVALGFGFLGGILVDSFSNPIVFGHLIIGMVCMAIWAIKAGRESLGNATEVIRGRTTRYGTHVLVYTAIFLAILVAANWLAHRHNKKVDLTEQGVYSLAPQSRELLDKLAGPLKLISFKGLSENDEQIRDIFSRFKDQNPAKISVDIIDPKSKPQLVEKYGMKQGNVAYLQYGEGEGAAVSRINEVSEESLANAILKLTKGASKKIYFLQGHAEMDIASTQPDGGKALALALQDEHLAVAPLLLATTGKVPDDASAIVVVAPRKNIPDAERKVLLDYADAGGKLLLMSDPRTTNDVTDLAAHFGIQVRSDVILDKEQRLFSGPTIGAQPIVTTYDAASPITKAFSAQTVTIFNIASSLEKMQQPMKGATYTSFAQSSPTAWGETNLADLLDAEEPKAEFNPDDNKGPVTLGMSFEKGAGRVVVFGDSDWIKNGNLNVYANRDLLLNAVNWLVGEEASLTIRAGTIRASYAPIPAVTFLLILLSSFIIPELLLLTGLWVWWKRKS
jgi:ABC-type uncharacterized transport system involved in gliding motility auxiliary subunit